VTFYAGFDGLLFVLIVFAVAEIFIISIIANQ